MENFNFNRDFYEACRALGERDGGRLAFALLRYGYEGAEPEKLPAALSAAFTLAKGRVDAMVSGSRGGRRGVAARTAAAAQDPTQDPTQDPRQDPRQGGSRGGSRPPTQDPRQQKEKEIKEEDPNGSSKKAPRFTAPTAEEVGAYAERYAAARGWGSPEAIGFDPERFVDFYASKGWKVGSSPMKDWKASVRGWICRDRKEGGADDGRFAAYA